MDVLSVLPEMGPLGLFAAYLVYDRREAMKRMDAWMAELVTDMKEDRAKASANELALRDRYDAVIAAKDKQLSDDRTEIIGLIKDLKHAVEKGTP